MGHDRNETGLFGAMEPIVHRSTLVPAEGARLVRVAFESGGDNLYDYAVPDGLADQVALGRRVKAPFGKGNRLLNGFCVEFPPKTDVAQVKTIAAVIDKTSLLDSIMLELAGWISRYYCCPLGIVLAAMVPAAVKKQVGMISRNLVRITPAGRAALEEKLRLSSPARTILNLLANDSQPISELGELIAQAQCSRAPADSLRKKGYVEFIQQKQFASLPDISSIATPPQNPINLNPDQQSVLNTATAAIDFGGFHAMLLHGVTGSGKTEIYIRCIERLVAAGRSALVMVPEISLTPQTLHRFLQRFERVAVMHSGLTPAHRHQQWRLIADGQADVVIGARSAVFAPLPNLGMIVVDEEHEPGYKQDTAPRYHGRDVAIKRAQMLKIPILLGSATPSLEMWRNTSGREHYQRLNLPRRVLDLPLPPVRVVDMRKEPIRDRKNAPVVSRLLAEEIDAALNAGRQVILLLNRRGHSSYIFCPTCDFILTCPNCDVSMTYHKRAATFERQQRDWLMCHYCLHSCEAAKVCPVCGKKLLLLGQGTQKAQEQIAARFPQARLHRVDSDNVKPGEYPKLLDQFGRGEIDILLGTQMIGKGLDFPNVGLVGVLNADTALSLPDFRSSERTFQLIAQVAGRAGRAAADGKVIVQTYMPDEPTIQLACRHDYLAFARRELNMRQRCELPPFGRLVRIMLRDRKFDKLRRTADDLRKTFDRIVTEDHLAVKVRGPVPPAIARMENYHRLQLILQAETPTPLQRLLACLRSDIFNAPVMALPDVDPINLM
ncbi:MAG: primosomal protein N' [Sedimentisphaerales bacterium]|nr:primosomal protein N' [Sedimentisphaerales bacterium]